jgi:aryl carrier-like protein
MSALISRRADLLYCKGVSVSMPSQKRLILVIWLRKTGYEMDTRQLRTFLTIATHGTFAHAADVVGLTPSAVSQHCPLTEATRKILNAETIARMPQGACVVNTARGGLIDEAALLDAVRSGHLVGAGLDSFAVEPPAADHPFFEDPRIVMTPHIGGVTRQAGARVGIEAVQGIFQVLEGKTLPPERIANRKLLASAATPSKMET